MKRISFSPNEIAAWPDGHKGCLECREVKPFSAFTKNSGCLFGYLSLCKVCRKPQTKADHLNRLHNSILLSNAKTRAKRDGLPFDLTIDDVVIPERCPILDIPLVRGGDQDDSPSIDKIVPALGYVRGNIAVISNRANRIKNNATPQELAKIAAWTVENTPKAYASQFVGVLSLLKQIGKAVQNRSGLVE